MDVDVSELNELAADLGRVSGKTIPLVEAVMKRAAQNIKGEMVDDARGSRHFYRIAPTISYDREFSLTSIAYEIGPDRSRGGQAPLAGIAYLGGSNGGGGTLDGDAPLRNEEPRMMAQLDAALRNVL